MKRYILFYIVLAVSNFSLLAFPALTERADSLYMRNEYHSAIKAYEESIRDFGASSEIYYNLGNAYYKSENLGKAILNYERAIKLDAGNENAIHNLTFVNTKIFDKLPDNRNFITRICDSILYSISSNSWAYISFAFLILLLAAIGSYIYFEKILIRKIGFFSAIMLFVGFLISISCSILSAMHSLDNNYAIVLDEAVMLSTSPREPASHAEEAILLHEGAKVEIIDSIQTLNDSTCRMWYEVKVNNDRAWIKSLSIEKI